MRIRFVVVICMQMYCNGVGAQLHLRVQQQRLQVCWCIGFKSLHLPLFTTHQHRFNDNTDTICLTYKTATQPNRAESLGGRMDQQASCTIKLPEQPMVSVMELIILWQRGSCVGAVV